MEAATRPGDRLSACSAIAGPWRVQRQGEPVSPIGRADAAP